MPTVQYRICVNIDIFKKVVHSQSEEISIFKIK